MASSEHQELEMIEQGEQVFPDPAADGTIPQQAYSEIGPPIIRCSLDPSGPLPSSMTPQHTNDRRERGSNSFLRPPAPSASGDATQLQIDSRGSMQKLELLDLDLLQHPVLDDIDMTLRRKVSFCGQSCLCRDSASVGIP